eukprot:TRINITY_DN2068_c0_g1_i1.p1 TRINITY_DN2068_c0_g1~~TRINITY_DN2068_c0_g1_i1.p1  ORF type:complete len:405 (+),score=66.34 TRINITY_DN2068_c0_g1_i1:92-1306(+)
MAVKSIVNKRKRQEFKPPLPKGKTPVHVLAEQKDLCTRLPNFRIKTLLHNEKIVHLSGPFSDEVPVPGENSLAYGTSISTYPSFPDNDLKQGDPICDSYRLQIHENGTLFVITDGCNWGERPREASNRAKDAFIAYLNIKISWSKTVRDIGNLLLNALAHAHHAVIHDKDDVWMAGTTTLLGGVIVEVDKKCSSDPGWVLVFISVGDCKTFVYSPKHRQVRDVTAGNRLNITDARDPGGRIGPYVRDGEPDLRNLSLLSFPLEEDDLVLVVSDGVHDNLDPQTLGKTPRDFGIENDNWKHVDQKLASDIKQKYECDTLSKIIEDSYNDDGSVTLEQVTQHLIKYCLETTENGRRFMELNPKAPLEHDYLKYPGKMDHTTCVTLRGGRSVSSKKKANIARGWPYE